VNQRVATTLRGLAEHHRVKLEYVGGLPGSVFGFADPQSRTIVISLNQPDCDVVFTTLHELAHFVLHIDQPYRLSIPRWLSWSFYRPHKSEYLGEIACKTKRLLRRKCGRELQADLWALIAYPQVATPDDVKAFLRQHPEKLKWVLLVTPFLLKHRIGQFIRSLIPLETAKTPDSPPPAHHRS
jgi:hypothetical protein